MVTCKVTTKYRDYWAVIKLQSTNSKEEKSNCTQLSATRFFFYRKQEPPQDCIIHSQGFWSKWGDKTKYSDNCKPAETGYSLHLRASWLEMTWGSHNMLIIHELNTHRLKLLCSDACVCLEQWQKDKQRKRVKQMEREISYSSGHSSNFCDISTRPCWNQEPETPFSCEYHESSSLELSPAAFQGMNR